MNLGELCEQAWSDSSQWFPAIHARGPVGLSAHLALGLAGEAGEVANLVKKLDRAGHMGTIYDRAEVGQELADVLTYVLILAEELELDLTAEYERKRRQNLDRFG